MNGKTSKCSTRKKKKKNTKNEKKSQSLKPTEFNRGHKIKAEAFGFSIDILLCVNILKYKKTLASRYTKNSNMSFFLIINESKISEIIISF